MSAKLFLQINMSLDGFIEDSRGEIDWHFSDDEFDEFIERTLRSIDAMVFGRVAFELLAQYWPTAEAVARHGETARLMNELPKYVVSNSLDRTDWHNSHIISGDVAAKINALKRESERDIALFAGAATARSFLRLGLIDEYRIILNPALLGAGTPLFAEDHRELQLLDVQRFRSGALLLTYA